MKSQHDSQNGGQDNRPTFSENEPFLHPEDLDLQYLSDDPGLEKEFSDLGFDLKSSQLMHSGSAGSFTVLTYHFPLGKTEEPLYLLEIRFLIGHQDRVGDVMLIGEEKSSDQRIIAIQAACINALDITADGPRFVFEKTYTIGHDQLPNKSSILADILHGQRSSLQQLQNILKFFQASKTVQS
ncbi:hypothetical protein ACQ86N_23150 [Puia sp. P3]|uniref:hypothetical protein n=1 Tax=Puia sp. P3 TaxID=3423952 RepID=UPI003D67FA10